MNQGNRLNDPQRELYVYASAFRTSKDLLELLTYYMDELEIDKLNKEDDMTALHCAIKSVDMEKVACLLDHNADPNIKSNNKDCFEVLFDCEKNEENILKIEPMIDMLLARKAVPLKKANDYDCWNKSRKYQAKVAKQKEALAISMEKINNAYDNNQIRLRPGR